MLRADKLEGYNERLQALFAPDIKKNAHDVKTLLSRLLDEGIAGGGFVFDTALAAYLLAPTDGSYELEKLGMTYFNQEFPKAKTPIWRRTPSPPWPTRRRRWGPCCPTPPSSGR